MHSEIWTAGYLSFVYVFCFRPSCKKQSLYANLLLLLFQTYKSDWSLYIRLLPKVSDKRIQNLSLNCQSFLCFCFSLSQSFNEYSVPGDFSQKHFWYLLSSKMPTIHIFLIWIVVYLATLSNIFNSCSFFFLLRIENNPIFCKNAKS